MIKILGIETLYKHYTNAITKEETFTHSGVDFARVLQPLSYLNKEKGFKIDVLNKFPISPDKLNEWENIIPNYDIVYSSYIDLSILYVAIKILCDKYKKTFIIDLDDFLWGVSPHHPHYEDYKVEYDAMGKMRMSESLYKRTVILKDVHYVTTTNQFLKYKIHEFAQHDLDTIKVFPNYIDLTRYDYKKIPKRNDNEIRINYIGGASHYDDLMKPDFINALKELMDKYPNLIFYTNGFFFAQLKEIFGYRYRFRLAYADVYKFQDKLWPVAMADDIFVAPLDNTVYSRSKSFIKYLEYGAGKKPGVYENQEPYTNIVKDGENGYLAKDKRDWVNKLSALIEDKKQRDLIGEKAYETICGYQIQGHLTEYKDFFKSIVDKN